MENSERRAQYGLRGKLISAVAMLMVAVIMCVSSTYAWFTLSTAPEVTGISTAVGANGALEMRLNRTNPLSEEVNATWGNLVDLGGDSDLYGSTAITLYPSTLNLDATGKLTGALLGTPVYGADGRVQNVNPNTVTSGTFANNTFAPDSALGFRTVGTVSGMTPRELAHRNAYVNIVSQMSIAQKGAQDSLSKNGSALAAIAVEIAFSSNPTYEREDVVGVGNMIADLEAACVSLEEAYRQAFLALAASQIVGGETDTYYETLSGLITAKVDGVYTTPLATLYEQIKTTVEGQTALAGFVKGIEQYLNATITYTVTENDVPVVKTVKGTRAAIDEAKDEYTALLAKFDAETDPISSCSDDDLMEALRPLVNTDMITVNGYAAKGENKEAIASSALSNGILVSMPSHGGVYADFADQCGNYKVAISIDAGSISSTLNGMKVNAYMETKSDQGTSYLIQTRDAVKGLPLPSNSDTVLPITEYYGYIIDLMFRTNASNSNLLLQQDPTDRIYDGNQNEETMGGGSKMTFRTESNTLGFDSIVNLMSKIRIVFFETNTGVVLKYGKLDVSDGNIENLGDGAAAEIYLYTPVANNQYEYETKQTVEVYYETVAGTTTYYTDNTKADVATIPAGVTPTPAVAAATEGEATYETTIKVTVYSNDGTTFYTDPACTTENVATIPSGVTPTKVAAAEDVDEENVICALTQNEEKAISVLVYLDGESIENKDVAAETAKSLVGTMNIQFASSATLVPMEYADLHTPGESSSTSASTAATAADPAASNP
ncbi:MAG: hypothetical protein E7452_09940 [Ruminococcaceae bacterium]|nr:hypothetical protein [Oscillospiraceae bacterium]